MPILIELEQFGKPEVGKNRFIRALQSARANNITAHPVFEWARTAEISRPTLVFDLRAIRERMCWLAEAAGHHAITPLLAVKSGTEKPYLEAAHHYLGGYDVSNLNEYSKLPENLQGKLVSLTSPALTDDPDALKIKGNDLIVTLDSRAQLDRFFAHSQSCEYILRIKGPDLLRGAEPADPAYYPVSRFGFRLEEVKDLLGDVRLKQRPPAGFHVHHGSEVNQLSTFGTLLNGLATLAQATNKPVKYLNLGGGWHCLARADIADILSVARRRFPLPCRIMLEPGRWYAETAGYAVGTIVNLSRDGNILRCTLDLSSRCHLHWSNPKLLHFTDSRHGECCIVQFYGSSCYESDLIGKYVVPYSTNMLADTGLGDGKQVILSNISTYSAEWNASFNGIQVADVVWITL